MKIIIIIVKLNPWIAAHFNYLSCTMDISIAQPHLSEFIRISNLHMVGRSSFNF